MMTVLKKAIQSLKIALNTFREWTDPAKSFSI